MYQQVNLADHTLVGQPGPLPPNLLGLPDSAVADISAVCNPPPPGMTGQGWWPVTLTTPSYDAIAQVPDGTYAYLVNVSGQTVTGTANLRALTAAELAANLASAQQTKSAAVDAQCQTLLTGGWTHTFSGSVGAKLLKTADDDRTDWLILQNSCIAAVVAGQGATVGAVIRTADNTNVSLSYSDCLQVLLAMAAWGASVYARSWALKDSITATTTQAALAAIDTTTGWPASS